jgi:hypothetical protein
MVEERPRRKRHLGPGRMLRASISESAVIPKLIRRVDDLLGQPHGMAAALTYTWIKAHLDGDGRMSGDPAVLFKVVIRLHDWIAPAHIREYVRAAAVVGLLQWYEVDGEPYIADPRFDEEQELAQRGTSRLPPPGSGIPLGVDSDGQSELFRQVARSTRKGNRRTIKSYERGTEGEPKVSEGEPKDDLGFRKVDGSPSESPEVEVEVEVEETGDGHTRACAIPVAPPPPPPLAIVQPSAPDWRRGIEDRWRVAIAGERDPFSRGVSAMGEPGLAELVAACARAAQATEQDPQDVFDRMVARFKLYRASCDMKPAPTPRAMVGHWQRLWESEYGPPLAIPPVRHAIGRSRAETSARCDEAVGKGI